MARSESVKTDWDGYIYIINRKTDIMVGEDQDTFFFFFKLSVVGPLRHFISQNDYADRDRGY